MRSDKYQVYVIYCLKKNLDASRPSEHPTQTGGKIKSNVKKLSRWDHIVGCKEDKTSSWHLNGFPDGSNIGSKQYIMSGRRP